MAGVEAEVSRYADISKLLEEDGKFQVSTLLYVMGPQSENIMTSFNLTDADSKLLDVVLQKFDNYFQPRRNIIHERTLFYSRQQLDGETVEMFVRSLYDMVDKCDFGQLKDEQLRDRIVVGLRDKQVSSDLQVKENLTLTQAISYARQSEAVKEQMNLQKNTLGSASVDESRNQKRGFNGKPKGRNPGHRPQNQQKKFEKSQERKAQPNDGAQRQMKKCKFCGGKHAYNRESCPALTSKCHKCSKTGHYAAVCRSSGGVQEVNDDFSIEAVSAATNPWMVKLKLAGRPAGTINFKIDSGADVSIVTPETYEYLRRPTLHQPDLNLRSAGGKGLTCLGWMNKTFRRKGKLYEVKLYLIEGARNNLLSREAATKMDLIHLSLNEAASVYGDIGLMKIKPVKIKLTPDAVPYCVTSPRRIPIPLTEPVRRELIRMERADVIQRVTEATEWCAPIVPVIKPNKSVRICVDLKRLNTCVLRERYMLPTIDDLLHQLHGAQVFSSLDASSGFWAVPLDPESQKLTTFITPYGRYCFRRLPFGITSAPEIFQRIMHDLLHDLPGVVLYMDDILVFGSSKSQHDERLKKVLDVIQSSGLKLNKNKCKFRVTSLDFLGHTVSADGIRPSHDKVRAVLELDTPSDVSSLRHCLGVMNYLARFCPQLSSQLQPLHTLLQSGRAWMWTEKHQMAFDEAKQIIAQAPVLAYFNLKNQTVVSADASSYGLGAVILQKQDDGQLQPIAFASRTLTAAEKNYAQIEKECLALTLACERFSQFLCGLQSFELLTDHRPLIPLINAKDIDQVPLRCQRLIIRLMKFNPLVKFVPGKDQVIADALSRLPLRHETSHETQAEEVELFADSLVSSSMSPSRIQQVKEATLKDEDLQIAIQLTKEGWPENSKNVPLQLKKLFHLRKNLSVIDGLLLYENRIYIPSDPELRRYIMERIHDGH